MYLCNQNIIPPTVNSPVTFQGTYQPASIYEDGTEKHNLYLGTENNLYYPTTAGITVNAFRGYFRLKNGLTAGEDVN